MVWGTQVLFDPMRNNACYSFPDANNVVHKEREMETGQYWFVTQLHGGHRTKLIENNHWIDSLEFIVEANTWLSIICSRVIPSRNEADVYLDRALLICAIIEGIPINVG
ncbi:hypothetical protein R3W88_014609, partial [Solanum pinnatisectum]